MVTPEPVVPDSELAPEPMPETEPVEPAPVVVEPAEVDDELDGPAQDFW
jgi:hypothetical protein